ncbi:MAG: pyridoxamine 5'-phosphate oxidase [Bacteroidota bacterium]
MTALEDSLSNTRKDYSSDQLTEETLNPNPFEQFRIWLNLAFTKEVPEPNAMTLSTTDKDGRPSSRIVLLRNINDCGFVFFTNYQSRKGNEMTDHPYVSLNFFWPTMERQVRIEGSVEKIAEAESDEYFNSRPRESQLGAWSSNQSTIVKSRAEFESRLIELDKQYVDKPVPRPAYWGGYCVIPFRFEFWQGRPNRLHDRFQFEKHNSEWKIDRLSP